MSDSHESDIYDGLEYQVSKEFESLKLDLDDSEQWDELFAIAPPEFEPMDLTQSNAIALTESVFQTEETSNARKKGRVEAELERSGRSDASTNESLKVPKSYGSLGRIIELSIKASHSGTSTIAAAVSRGVAIDGKKMLSNNTTQRKAISEGQTALSKDDQRKAICKRFFRLMNVGDMMGLAKFVSDNCCEACTLISPDLLAEITGRLEVMMLFSLLYEAYPDGIWTVTNTSCAGQSVIHHYRFMGTGVVDFPLNTLFLLIQQHSQKYMNAVNAEDASAILAQHQEIADAVADFCHPPSSSSPCARAEGNFEAMQHQQAQQIQNQMMNTAHISNSRNRIGRAQSYSACESNAEDSSVISFPSYSSFIYNGHGAPPLAPVLPNAASFKGSASRVQPKPRAKAEPSQAQMLTAVTELCQSVRSGGSTPLAPGGADSPCSVFLPPQRKLNSFQSLRDIAAEVGGLSRPQQVIPLAASSVDSIESCGASQSIADAITGEDGRIHIPRRKESLQEMGIIENNILKNGPITHRRIITFTFDGDNRIEQIRMQNQ